jgi:transcriptional regulator with XRE-family HTH domain
MANENPLGELLRRRREELKFSRTRAAQLSGVNASTIQAWEHGRVAKPPFQDVMRLARALSIPMHELERVALAEPGEARDALDAPADASAAAMAAVGGPLLDRAMAVLGWDEAAAAATLGTTVERVGDLRRGAQQMEASEVLMLTAVLAAASPVPGSLVDEVTRSGD